MSFIFNDVLFLDLVDQLLETVDMIRAGYMEFGRQIAISIVNVLVFAVETVVGIFFQVPKADRISQVKPYTLENNERHHDADFASIEYNDPYYGYHESPNFIPYEVYNYSMRNVVPTQNAEYQRKSYLL